MYTHSQVVEVRKLLEKYLFLSLYYPPALMVGRAQQRAPPVMCIGQHAVLCESRILHATRSSQRCLCYPLDLHGYMTSHRRSEAFSNSLVLERVDFVYDGAIKKQTKTVECRIQVFRTASLTLSAVQRGTGG